MPKDTMTLSSAHSVVMGNIPDTLKFREVDIANVAKEHGKPHMGLLVDTSKLGQDEIKNFWFGGGSTSGETYNPELSPKDFNPTDDEFIYPVYRLLSNVTVNSYYPINFPEEVLRESMEMLMGQTVNTNHDTSVHDAVGSIVDVSWESSYTASDGTQVPSGINGKLKIDAKSNPKLARGIMMDPPSIHSNSVTITFSWEKSHPELTDGEFYDKLGSYGKDGRLIQRVATEIHSYSETSLVAHGADPYAKKIGENGQIVNPGMAKSKQRFSEFTDKVEDGRYFFSGLNYRDSTSILTSLSESTGDTNHINNNEKELNMKEHLLFLTTQFGFTEGELTEENYQSKVGEKIASLSGRPEQSLLDTANARVTELEGEVATLTEQNNAFQGVNLSELNTQAEVGRTAMEAERAEASRLYALAVEKTDEAIVNLINTGDFKTVTALKKQYESQTDGKFSATCQKCGSTEVTRASASPSTPTEGNPVIVVSNKDARESVYKKRTPKLYGSSGA